MLNYKEFKVEVEKGIKAVLPESLQGKIITLEEVEKVNQKREGMALRDPEKQGEIAPTIYFDDLYKHYQECEDLTEVLEAATSQYEQAYQQLPDINLDQEKAKDNIVFQLINTEQNKEMLESMPHRAYQDLSIIYRWVVDIEDSMIQSIVIRDAVADSMGLSEEQLFQVATENTKRLFQPTVQSMNEVMSQMLVEDGMPEEMIDMMFGSASEKEIMWVISNEVKTHGATTLLYEDVVHELAEKIGTDLYIMPSSIHETIAVSTDMGNPEELAEMVQEINAAEVALEDRLSNQVYYYDKELRTLSLATDTPNKRLDGQVAEQVMEYDKGKSR